MTAFKINQFGGELPAWDPKLLPPGQSQESVDAYLFSGGLQGWREPTALRNLTNPSAAFVYRIPQTTFNSEGVATFATAITAPSTWIEAVDPDTNVVRSQVVNDAFQRYYMAAPTIGPPLYNTLQRIQNSAPFFQLGIPAPTIAPLVGVSGGGNLATLGPTSSVGGGTTVPANVIYLLPIVPSGSSQVNTIQFMPIATNPACQFFAVVYEDALIGGNVATKPGALLGTSQIDTGITGGTLATATFTNPIALDSNTPYWIGICLSVSETIALGDGINGSGFFNSSFSGGPPVFAPATTLGASDLQMFANITTSAVLESRSYVYTYISAYGEEGPPSPPTLLTGWSNGTWTVNYTGPPANYFGNSGTGNIAILRIYRTVVSTAGAATYFLVADISVGSTDADAVLAVQTDPTPCLPPQLNNTYTDILPDSTVALNLQLASENYFPPPSNLQGLTILPNGMYVGFVGTQVWFSVPYLPHAWPPGFVYTVDFPIVGLGVTAGALVAATNSNPFVFNGTNPASMSQVRCAPAEPCLSRGSIVSTDLGVFYESENGLIQVTAQGAAGNATELWITREKWEQLVPQKYLRAVPFLGTYFSFGTVSPPGVSPVDTSVAQSGIYIEMNTDSSSFTIWPEPGGHRIGFNRMNAPNGFNVSNVQLDPWTGICMLIQDGQVFYYDFTNPAPAIQPYDWTSKVFQQNSKTSFAAFKVFFTVPPGVQNNPGQGAPAQRNTALPSDPSWQTLGATAWAYILFYADVDDGSGDGSMQLICAREVQRSGEVLRILDGFKAENWQVRILARVNISNIQVATSVRELGKV